MKSKKQKPRPHAKMVLPSLYGVKEEDAIKAILSYHPKKSKTTKRAILRVKK